MAKFISENELNSQLVNLFENATKQIIIISPYIRLHERFIEAFKLNINNPEFKMTIVFRKNEDEISKSMNQADFELLKNFHNIEIYYHKRLHAKYYANETISILTSMNLYNFSQDKNIEAGILMNANFIGNLVGDVTTILGGDNIDRSAWAYFSRVIDKSELIFKKSPIYGNSLMGVKTFKMSNTEIDRLSPLFEKINGSSPLESTSFEENIDLTMANFVDEHQEKNSAYQKLVTLPVLSSEIGIKKQELERKLEDLNWIKKTNNKHELTMEGKKKGGEIRIGRYGEFIVWPISLKDELK